MNFSYKRIIPAGLILLGFILFFIGWKVNTSQGIRGGDLNLWMILARASSSAGWSYIIVDAIVNFFEKRRLRNH